MSGGDGGSVRPGPPTTDKAAELIERHGLDATKITGTGTDGRITQPDVLTFMKSEGLRSTDGQAIPVDIDDFLQGLLAGFAQHSGIKPAMERIRAFWQNPDNYAAAMEFLATGDNAHLELFAYQTRNMLRASMIQSQIYAAEQMAGVMQFAAAFLASLATKALS